MTDIDNNPFLRLIASIPSQNNFCITTEKEHHDFIGGLVCISSNEAVSSSEDCKMIAMYDCLVL